MRGFTRRRAMVAVGVASAVALLGLAGCGRLDRSSAPAADSARARLTTLGYRNVAVFPGGKKEWAEAGLRLETATTAAD